MRMAIMTGIRETEITIMEELNAVILPMTETAPRPIHR
jgi:hypothetical protein